MTLEAPLHCILLNINSLGIVQDSGSGAFLTPGSGMGKKSGSGSGMNIPDHISEGLQTIFRVKILKFFVADPGSGMERIRIQDQGWKNSDPVSGMEKIWIRDKHPGSATLALSLCDCVHVQDGVHASGEH
jgi:hypothetical protein